MKTIDEFKEEVIKMNDKINEEMYGCKLDWQKIDIIGDKIIILALNRRISVLKYIDEKDMFTARLMDLALLNEFKIKLKRVFENKFGLKLRSVLKDYDPVNQLAATMIIAVEPVEQFITKIDP
ncbi:MAG: DUF2294 domain-containing protein [Tepidanaerobacteraceae bacterium]|jgi:hypothetical protein